MGVTVVVATLIIVDTAARAGRLDAELEVVRTVLLLTGGVALLVGGFIVSITMSVTVAQRTQELALLRCLGASVAQLRRLVLAEALGIGGLGAALGLGLGLVAAVGLRALINLDGFPGYLPGSGLTITARTVGGALVIGCGVTALSALGPARRAGLVPPMAALRDQADAPGRAGLVRTLAGAVLLAVAAATVAAAAASRTGPLLLLGGLLVLVGFRLAGPRTVPVLASVIGAVVAAVAGPAGQLARRGATREPHRSAAVASALMVGVALMCLVTVILASIRLAMATELDRYRADLELTTTVEGTAMPPDTPARLRALAEVAAAVPERCTGAVVAGEPDTTVCAIEPGELASVIVPETTAGSLSSLATGGIAVTEDAARANGWRVGSPVAVELPRGSATLNVVAVYRAFYFLGAPLISPEDYGRLGGNPGARTIYLRIEPGVAGDRAETAVAAAVADLGSIDILTRADILGRNLDQIARVVWVYRTLTGMATLVGLAGVVNVLTLSIVERRREIGVLRVIGMQRRQVRAMIRAESVMLTVVGVAAGMGLGTLFGWAAVAVLEDAAQPVSVSTPIATIVAIGGFWLVAAVFVAGVPARSAARIDILRAIATD
jgi:putative ABC transport system permease protein